MSSIPTSIKQVQSHFFTFIQSYKQLFNTTYTTIQTQSNPPVESHEFLQQKQQLINELYQNYRQVIQGIDSLEQVHVEERKMQRDFEEDQSQKNVIGYGGNLLTNGNSLGNIMKEDQKYEMYEKEICQEHDKAVQRYKQAIKRAEIWREHLYKYINANMPSGNH